MGALDNRGVYEMPIPGSGLGAPGGVLRFPPQTEEEMQTKDVTAPGPRSNGILNLPGDIIGALIAAGTAYALHRHYSGNNSNATPGPVDPDFRALTRRPSEINGDQPVTAYSSGANTAPTSTDVGAGVTEGNPTAVFTGQGLAAKAHDPNKPKVRTIPDAPPIAPAEGEPPPDVDCDEERKREREICEQAEGWNWKGRYAGPQYRPRKARKWTADDCVGMRVSEACGGDVIPRPGDPNYSRPKRSK